MTGQANFQVQFGLNNFTQNILLIAKLDSAFKLVQFCQSSGIFSLNLFRIGQPEILLLILIYLVWHGITNKINKEISRSINQSLSVEEFHSEHWNKQTNVVIPSRRLKPLEICLKIQTDWKLRSFRFTKREVVEFGTTEPNPTSWFGGLGKVLSPGPWWRLIFQFFLLESIISITCSVWTSYRPIIISVPHRSW